MIRHKFLYRPAQNPVCECGYDPTIILESEGKDVFWSVTVWMLMAHLKKARRWVYQGVEEHYGFKYHLWQNELSGRKYAWEAETFRDQNTSLTA